ncbi:L-methionine/branched-chain amino acid transporter [Motilimonas eburnea]|uniref:L-methionine/branched-chain amino acid transporter n=1 Tax=Motilimonas eburnea TaxID=1737488 RepID=UPI001E52E440|nr:L-methionine/branched-chain amino acid transporter [Motilimonas eburnea]MCE2571072.1 L-methionine/branched-chain amino acid transporter [Motilimonas eburnea]
MKRSQQGITVYQGAGMLLATLLGSGVLLVPALVASYAGVYSLLAWSLMALAVLPIVFTFAALGRAYANQGGTAHFVQLAFGRRAAASLAWLYVSIAPIGPPVVIITGAAYFAQLFNLSMSLALWLELLMLGVIFVLNIVKLTTSVRLQTWLSYSVTSIIIVVCVVALSRSEASLPSGELQWSDVGQSMAAIFWCFVGIEAICHVANEFNRPKQDFPRAVVLGVAMAAAIYVLLSIAVLQYGAYGDDATNLLSVIQIAQAALGPLGGKLIALVGFVACFCAVNLYVLSFARMLASMAEKGQVMTSLGKQNRNQSPVFAVLIVTLAIALILVLKHQFAWSFAHLLAYANAVFVLIYLAAGLSAIKLLPGRQRYLAWFTALFCSLIAMFMAEDVLYGVGVFVVAFAIDSMKQNKAMTEQT